MGFLIKWLYPAYARCFCCGHPRLDEAGDHLCPNCREALLKLRLMGTTFAVQTIEKVYAPYRYEKQARELVHCLKYTSVREAAHVLGDKMAACLEGNALDGLVPVPLHTARQRERGFNQAELLAQEVSRQTGIPVMDILTRTRETGQQARMGKEKRQSNLEGAFNVSGTVKGLKLLVVDDVCTTGATVKACAKALSSAGAREVSLLVAAVTLKTGHA